MVVCKYCNREFKNTSSLNNHVKSAKYCLELRGEKNDNRFKCKICDKILSTKQRYEGHIKSCQEDVTCEYCNEMFSNKNSLIVHHSSCMKKFESTIEKLKEKHANEIKEQSEKYEKQIKELQDKLERIATESVKKPTKIINNTQRNNILNINNLFPLTDKYIEDQVENFSTEHIKKGHVGYVDYFLNYPLNNRILCSDYGRKIVEYVDNNGKVITEPGLSQLIIKLFQSIKERNKKLIQQYIDELKKKYNDKDVEKIICELSNLLIMVERGCDGEKTNLCHNLIKDICSRSIPFKKKNKLQNDMEDKYEFILCD